MWPNESWFCFLNQKCSKNSVLEYILDTLYNTFGTTIFMDYRKGVSILNSFCNGILLLLWAPFQLQLQHCCRSFPEVWAKKRHWVWTQSSMCQILIGNDPSTQTGEASQCTFFKSRLLLSATPNFFWMPPCQFKSTFLIFGQSLMDC